jgi:membrane protease YdiL (CAAX protease family)
MAELPVWKKLVVIAVAMTVEEAFFRAFLQPRLGLSLASVLFALSHTSYGQPFLVVGVFIVSLFFGGLFARTGSLFAPMVAHGLFNGVQLFVVLPAIVRVFGTG